MREILETYHKISEEYCEKKKAIDAKIEAKQEKVEALKTKLARAEKVIEGYEKAISKLHRPSMYQDIIEPLAKKLSEHFGMPYELYGPYGTECETSIYLRKDMSRSICDQSTISLTLRPDWKENWLNYNTGEKLMKYPKGSFGDTSGLNDVYAPLPMDFEEILKLVVYEEREEVQEGGEV